MTPNSNNAMQALYLNGLQTDFHEAFTSARHTLELTEMAGQVRELNTRAVMLARAYRNGGWTCIRRNLGLRGDDRGTLNPGPDLTEFHTRGLWIVRSISQPGRLSTAGHNE